MNKKLIGIAILLSSLSFLSCQNEIVDSTVYFDMDGIQVEKLNDSISDPEKYNRDNTIYRPDKKFTFGFTFHRDGQQLYANSYRKGWQLVPESDTLDIAQSYEMTILKGNPMAKYVPNYSQTAILFNFPDKEGGNMTGLVENKRNLWMHPTREGVFKILQLAPFPFIEFPIEKGKSWSWQLDIGDGWSDERLVSWEGPIDNKITYTISDFTTLETSLGKLECTLINAISSNKLGTTNATFYFNEKYGFVQMNYQNLDGSTMQISLDKIEEITLN